MNNLLGVATGIGSLLTARYFKIRYNDSIFELTTNGRIMFGFLGLAVTAYSIKKLVHNIGQRAIYNNKIKELENLNNFAQRALESKQVSHQSISNQSEENNLIFDLETTPNTGHEDVTPVVHADQEMLPASKDQKLDNDHNSEAEENITEKRINKYGRLWNKPGDEF